MWLREGAVDMCVYLGGEVIFICLVNIYFCCGVFVFIGLYVFRGLGMEVVVRLIGGRFCVRYV